MTTLNCEIIEPELPADATIIWLHGLGASGHDFIPIIPQLTLPESLAVRFVFPHAPEMAVTINGGIVMPAWYDIYSMEMNQDIDITGINNSADAVTQLIDHEIESGIDSHRIILAGFSQGGAIAYHTALSYNKPLGGLMALSSYFASGDTIDFSNANHALPVAIYHGVMDTIVPEVLAVKAKERLENMQLHPEYHHYPMAHEVHPKQIDDMSVFIQQVLG